MHSNQFYPLLLFTFVINITYLILKATDGKFILDKPNDRKIHQIAVPQIGGIIFGSILIFVCWYLSIAPKWYLIGGSISIMLGVLDDFRPIKWSTKLIVQILLSFYLISTFWNVDSTVIFYGYSLYFNNYFLSILFFLWFIGIYNSVNLIDGLDGLAGGFMIIITFSSAFSPYHSFNQINLTLCILLLTFLVFNQRQAKLFMGDSGSLFLGFHMATLPLLYMSQKTDSTEIIMTPFLLITSYLIADTLRVFITRISEKKNPMNADTIHFHHLVLKQSNSYLASIGSIYIITAISSVFAIISFKDSLSQNVMIIHLSALLLFILTPPIETYVPIITRLVKPFYSWQKRRSHYRNSNVRTILMLALLLGLLITSLDFDLIFKSLDINLFFSILLLISFILINGRKKISIYSFQIFLLLILGIVGNNDELTLISKLLVIFSGICIVIFTLQKRTGTAIYKYSSLDALMLILVLTASVLNLLIPLEISLWIIMRNFVLWFGTSFIIKRFLKFI